MKLLILAAVLLCGSVFAGTEPLEVPTNCAGSQVTARTLPSTQHGPGGLAAGHAHNDYEHRHPLTDALHAGFTSVEADIWLNDGQLLVGHTWGSVDPSRTLDSLYLGQLAERYAVHPDARPVQLVVDVKSSPEQTLPVLHTDLARYRTILTTYDGCTPTPRSVDVVVGGTVTPSAPQPGTVEYFGYDFQPDHAADSGDLEAAVTPLVSAHWSTLFTWDGSGPMPQDERDRLDDIADSVHEAGARLRLWGAPDGPSTDRANLWATLTAAGVDYINTDHLRAYASLSGR